MGSFCKALVTAGLILALAHNTQQARLLEEPYTGPQNLTLGALAKLKLAAPSKGNANLYAKALQLADVPNKCDDINRIADKLIVVAVHKEDISWLVRDVDVPFLAYHSGNATTRVHNNGAKEGSAYLQFIAEYYDCLPEVTAFIHAHRSSWHSRDMVDELHRLNWTSSKTLGYMPLHQGYFQPYGMYFGSKLADPSEHLQTVVAKEDPKAGETFNGTTYEAGETYHYRQAQEIAHAWGEFWGPAGLGPMPQELRYYCCAQFLATTERIRRLPREFYLQAIHWTANSKGTGNFTPEFTRGVIMESLWHIIMGEPAYMPTASSTELCDHFSCDDRKR